jgi:hypothetical protein
MGIHVCGPKLPPGHLLEGKLFGPIKMRKETSEEREAGERFQNLLRNLRDLKDDDEWWFWKMIGSRSFYSKTGKPDKKAIKTYLKMLQKIFDNTWWSQYCKTIKRKIILDPLSYFGGQDRFFRILRIGECSWILRKEIFSQKELIKRLRNAATFWNAATELEVAACFKQENILSEMYPKLPSGHKPDGVVLVNDTEVYYEVTEQSWSALYKPVFRAESMLVDWVNDKLGPINGQIQFFRGKESPNQYAEKEIKVMSRKLLGRPLPLRYKTKIFCAIFNKSPYNGGWLGISGLEPDFTTVVRVWVKGLFSEAKHLPPNKCGVIIGSPMFLWGPEEVKTSYDTIVEELRRHPHRRVCGFIFAAKHIENSGFLKHVPRVVINPRAKFRCDEIISRMADALFKYPDWI